jgi:hypothetical protein
MTRPPYWDTEPNGQEPEPSVELRLQTDCAICGHHDEFGTITLRLAWYRADQAPKAVARCLDVTACRSRVAAKRERWPLLERGEIPVIDEWRLEPEKPMQPISLTTPDEQEDDDAWI